MSPAPSAVRSAWSATRSRRSTLRASPRVPVAGMTETPIATTDGVSRRRDRTWGLIGGALGVAVGVGSAAIAIFVEGANAFDSTVPYPRFFTKRELLTYDIFLAVVIAAGALFGISAVILGRRSRFPRTDAMGGALCATVLLVLGSALLFTRLIAVIRSS